MTSLSRRTFLFNRDVDDVTLCQEGRTIFRHKDNNVTVSFDRDEHVQSNDDDVIACVERSVQSSVLRPTTTSLSVPRWTVMSSQIDAEVAIYTARGIHAQ